MHTYITINIDPVQKLPPVWCHFYTCASCDVINPNKQDRMSTFIFLLDTFLKTYLVNCVVEVQTSLHSCVFFCFFLHFCIKNKLYWMPSLILLINIHTNSHHKLTNHVVVGRKWPCAKNGEWGRRTWRARGTTACRFSLV